MGSMRGGGGVAEPIRNACMPAGYGIQMVVICTRRPALPPHGKPRRHQPGSLASYQPPRALPVPCAPYRSMTAPATTLMRPQPTAPHSRYLP